MSGTLDPRVVDLINYAEPDHERTGMILAPDLVPGAVDRAFLEFAASHLERVLADEAVSAGDLKGALNRASCKTWGIEYDRRFTPREFLQALRMAIQNHLRQAV